jgi:hypothetical protein
VLGAVEVQGKAHVNVPGFEDRAKRGFGTFLTREDIDKRQPILLTDLFRSVPGLTVGFDGTNYIVQSSRSVGTGCQVQWWVDGSPFDNMAGDMDQMLRPDDIEAVEVYKSASEVPVQFQGRDASCGTVVVWTKRGGARKAKKERSAAAQAAKLRNATPTSPSRRRLSARSRSWRTRSRVTPSIEPISSSVCSRPPSRPK